MGGAPKGTRPGSGRKRVGLKASEVCPNYGVGGPEPARKRAHNGRPASGESVATTKGGKESNFEVAKMRGEHGG